MGSLIHDFIWAWVWMLVGAVLFACICWGLAAADREHDQLGDDR